MTGCQADPAAAPQTTRYPSGILHGRRQGRRLRVGPSALMQDLLPRYEMGPEHGLDPAALFPRPVSELRLEVGFGGGEHLVSEAGRHPDAGFIGCEPFRNGVARILQHLHERPHDNLRLHVGDAGEIIDRLPDSALTQVDLLYPDPWPKRRQRKRRFVSTARLDALARVLKPGGEFRFATDIDDYAGWTLARVLAHPAFTWTAQIADDWRLPWDGWVQTRYEAKARREGRPSAYLTFVRR